MFVDFLALQPGQRILLKNRTVAEVVENIGDGLWVQGRVLEAPADPSLVDSVELCHCEDVVQVLEAR